MIGVIKDKDKEIADLEKRAETQDEVIEKLLAEQDVYEDKILDQETEIAELKNTIRILNLAM